MQQVEIFPGLSFWHKYGDGSDVLTARGQAGPESLFTRFSLFAPEFLEFSTTFAIAQEGKVVALAGCTLVDTRSKSIGLQYVEVDEATRGVGLSSKLCKAIFDFMPTQGIKRLDCSGYSKIGHERLRHVLLREAAEHNLRLKDRDCVEYGQTDNATAMPADALQPQRFRP